MQIDIDKIQEEQVQMQQLMNKNDQIIALCKGYQELEQENTDLRERIRALESTIEEVRNVRSTSQTNQIQEAEFLPHSNS